MKYYFYLQFLGIVCAQGALMTYLYKWFHCAGDKDKTNNEDDDILSVSAMSIASSSSLASAVYERAKKRRDHFWSHQKHGRATN